MKYKRIIVTRHGPPDVLQAVEEELPEPGAGEVRVKVLAAGISAYPMAARVVQVQGQRYDRQNYLLMHAMGANTGGQIGSVMAAAVMLSVLKGMGLI